jgi:hypothetical protein
VKHTNSNLQTGGIHHSSCLKASLLGTTCLRPPLDRPAAAEAERGLCILSESLTACLPKSWHSSDLPLSPDDVRF